MEPILTDEQVYKTLVLTDDRFKVIDNNNAASTDSALELAMLSKIAVIEFCGWMEVSFDEILENYVLNANLNPSIVKECKDEIKNVYGCDPERNVKPLLRRILGVKRYNGYILSTSDLLQICASIERIGGVSAADPAAGKMRNVAAHTNIKSPTQTYFSAPSLVLAELKKVHPLLWRLRTTIVNNY